ncbi:hypothetical protein SUGI_0706120 [Cryptomeria japonica]|nr:hypothetical protein SUGI_0706120 [Cryptomeria japonica]
MPVNYRCCYEHKLQTKPLRHQNQRQKHRQEIISNLGNMCYELLVQEYADTEDKRLPQRIIFFRDEVHEKELVAFKDALKEFEKKRYLEEDYNP